MAAASNFPPNFIFPHPFRHGEFEPEDVSELLLVAGEDRANSKYEDLQRCPLHTAPFLSPEALTQGNIETVTELVTAINCVYSRHQNIAKGWSDAKFYRVAKEKESPQCPEILTKITGWYVKVWNNKQHRYHELAVKLFSEPSSWVSRSNMSAYVQNH